MQVLHRCYEEYIMENKMMLITSIVSVRKGFYIAMRTGESKFLFILNQIR
jgi:hypothetical protein